MAKVFAGFTPEQLGKIDSSLAGKQSDEQQKIIAANPALAARVGKMSELAQQRIGMAYGGYMNKGYAVGGMADQVVAGATGSLTSADLQTSLDSLKTGLEQTDEYKALQEYGKTQGQPSFDPKEAQRLEAALQNTDAYKMYQSKGAQYSQLKQQETTKQQQADTEASFKKSGETAGTLAETAIKDPSKLVTDVDVTKFTEEDKASGEIAEGTGQLEGPAPEAKVTTAEAAAPVAEPTKTPAATVTAETVTPEIEKAVDKVVAATGKPSDEALAEAATMSPDELAQLDLTVEQIEEAQKVKAPDPRKVEEGEMIEGSAVDMERVKKEVNFEAATGAPSSDATVQGQLTGLMEDFEGKQPPAWAAGAMRAAAARMASRGLSASSMAGQAMVQAAMESAIPIAQQDAKTSATFELQNLSNKQQTAMFAAQQRAQFLNLEFNQEFQTRVANAAKISEIANMNFTAEQQVALENARMAQTVDITNLNAKNAKIMADAAAMSQLDMANLNNRQQAQVQTAQAFLQMDMANLNNEQATNMFKAQSMVNAMLSDQAAENAAKQFNASSENQVNQFFADLGARVSLANAEQSNLMSRFNAGEANALAQFNTQVAEQRNQFNAANSLVIAQANAQWAQTITTTENAAQNEANRLNAKTANEFTALGYNTTIQQYRDMMSYAWKTGDNDAQRATQLAIAQLQADTTKYAADKASQDAANTAAASRSSALWGALGTFAGSLDWGSIL